ncbi:MAG TPA: GNAT family N-acetyltransferase [Rhizomicrobium sp.]|jgi:hypothetical protein|nr:GNAT family N-acetyltransferase [Rhizomicrobium sp.]
MNVEIALAGRAHRDWLLAEDTHIPPACVERCIAAGEYLVAMVDGAPAGFLRFSWFWRAIPYMELVRATPRNRGIGTALFAAWETAMRAAGAKLLMTSSMSDEPEPQAWHRRNGFVESGSLTFGALQTTAEVFFVKPL